MRFDLDPDDVRQGEILLRRCPSGSPPSGRDITVTPSDDAIAVSYAVARETNIPIGVGVLYVLMRTAEAAQAAEGEASPSGVAT
jgi:hypothetical protein